MILHVVDDESGFRKGFRISWWVSALSVVVVRAASVSYLIGK